MTTPPSEQPDSKSGFVSALSAFVLWGFLPLYFNAIGPRITAWEILLHRIVWAVPLLAIFILLTRRWKHVRAALADRRMLLTLCISGLLVSTNWGLFIWAVTHDHVLESSLGYYINPLLNVLFGFVFFRERLRPLQGLAVAIATIGVLIMVIAFGEVPWIALSLALLFCVYGVIHKRIAMDSVSSIFIETLVLLPAALIWLAGLYANHDAGFGLIDWRIDLLLIGCGAMTVVPLVLFANGTQRLRLGTVGLIQYVTPTMHLLTGVWLLGEAFTEADGITFAFIWTGLAIYAFDTLRAQHRQTAAMSAGHGPA